MRMWMIDPSKMCRKHLLGEHLETHMFLGTIKNKISLLGYMKNNCVEPKSIITRHQQLADEMIRRGYNHQSPIDLQLNELLSYLPTEVREYKVDTIASEKELMSRCEECRKRIKEK